jgi:hypothetical protein
MEFIAKCPICLEQDIEKKMVLLFCGHIICLDCFKTIHQSNTNRILRTTCPLCRRLVAYTKLRKSYYQCITCKNYITFTSRVKKCYSLTCGHSYCIDCLMRCKATENQILLKCKKCRYYHLVLPIFI